MDIISSTAKVLCAGAVLLFTLSGNATAQNNTDQTTALNLKKFQYLSVVLPQAKPNSEATRKSYYQQAFPLAAEYGLKQEMALQVDEAIISDYAPSAAIFFSYPNRNSELALSNHAEWPDIKKLRPQSWDELRIYSAEIEENVNIQFDPDKSYTLVIAWINPDNPDDYFTYLDKIEPTLNEVGGRFIYKMKAPQFEAHATTLGAPAQLTFVEWDTLEGFAELRRNENYKAVSHYFGSGTSNIEFYRMTVPSK